MKSKQRRYFFSLLPVPRKIIIVIIKYHTRSKIDVSPRQIVENASVGRRNNITTPREISAVRREHFIEIIIILLYFMQTCRNSKIHRETTVLIRRRRGHAALQWTRTRKDASRCARTAERVSTAASQVQVCEYSQFIIIIILCKVNGEMNAGDGLLVFCACENPQSHRILHYFL